VDRTILPSATPLSCGSHYSAVGGATVVWFALVRGFTPDRDNRDTSCGRQVEGTPTPSINKHNPHPINKATARIILFCVLILCYLQYFNNLTSLSQCYVFSLSDVASQRFYFTQCLFGAEWQSNPNSVPPVSFGVSVNSSRTKKFLHLCSAKKTDRIATLTKPAMVPVMWPYHNLKHWLQAITSHFRLNRLLEKVSTDYDDQGWWCLF